jgi:hypothetical protein
MVDPLGFFLLLGLAVLGLSVGVVGLRRGRVVALVDHLRFARTEKPIRFWYGVCFQIALGSACLVLAIIKAVTSDESSVREFVNDELSSIDGERLDSVCPELVQQHLLLHAADVVREVAQASDLVAVNLGTCIDHSVSIAERPRLLAVLRSMNELNSKETLTRDAAIARLENPNPNWP